MTLWTVARQAPLSVGLSRPEYWSGLSCPSPGDLPDPGIKHVSLALQADSLLFPLPHSSVGKESTGNEGHPNLIPGSGRSTGEGIGYPLQYSGLENSMDCIESVTKNQIRLSNFHFTSRSQWVGRGVKKRI